MNVQNRAYLYVLKITGMHKIKITICFGMTWRGPLRTNPNTITGHMKSTCFLEFVL